MSLIINEIIFGMYILIIIVALVMIYDKFLRIKFKLLKLSDVFIKIISLAFQFFALTIVLILMALICWGVGAMVLKFLIYLI